MIDRVRGWRRVSSGLSGCALLAWVAACGGAQTAGDDGDQRLSCSASACQMAAPGLVVECFCDADGALVSRLSNLEDGGECREVVTGSDEGFVSIAEYDWESDGYVDHRERRDVQLGQLVAADYDHDLDGTFDSRDAFESVSSGTWRTAYTWHDYELDGVWDVCDVETFEGEQLLSAGPDYDCDRYADETYTYVDCYPPYLDCDLAPYDGVEQPSTAEMTRELARIGERPQFDDIALDRSTYDLAEWETPEATIECPDDSQPYVDGEVARSCDGSGRPLVVLAFDNVQWSFVYHRLRYDTRGRVAGASSDSVYGPITTAEALYDFDGQLVGVIRYSDGSGLGTTIEHYVRDPYGVVEAVSYDYGADGTIDAICTADCGSDELLRECLVLYCD